MATVLCYQLHQQPWCKGEIRHLGVGGLLCLLKVMQIAGSNREHQFTTDSIMDNICSMLLLICLATFFHITFSQFHCGSNCLCFDDLVDCSRHNLKVMPTFRRYTILSTKRLLLRHMPDLDLTTFDCPSWRNLEQLNLKG